MFTTFYHGMTKKLTAGFGTLFNNMYIERGENATYKKIKVPLSYAPKEKMMERIGLELDNPSAAAVQLTLPRMSFMLTGLEYDTERKRNSSGKRMSEKTLENSDIIINYHYNEVPYKLNFSLFVYARTMDDGLKIIEQIFPFFTPSCSNFSISFNLPFNSFCKSVVLPTNIELLVVICPTEGATA